MLARNPDYVPSEPRPLPFSSFSILIVGSLVLGFAALLIPKATVTIVKSGETPRAVLPSIPRLPLPTYKRRKIRPQ